MGATWNGIPVGGWGLCSSCLLWYRRATPSIMLGRVHFDCARRCAATMGASVSSSAGMVGPSCTTAYLVSRWRTAWLELDAAHIHIE